MAKLPSLKYVKFTRAKGKVYAYFNTGKKIGGKPVWIRLPDPASVGFFDSYASAMGARTKNGQKVYTIADLSEAYQNSLSFKALKPASQRSYVIALRKIVDAFGRFPFEKLTRQHIRQVVEHIPGAASRNLFIAVIGVIYKWARDGEMTNLEPTRGLARYKTGEHEPWPQDILDAALVAEDDIVRLSVSLLYYTGQRIGDALKMRWSDVREGKMAVKQEKTDKPLLVALHRNLAAELAQTQKRGITIIAKPNGRPYGDEAVRERIQKFATELGYKVVPHGLRKNAVNSLLEAGCTISEVQAVTGQSTEMVAHYAKQVDQSRLSEAAIYKLERRR